MVCKIDVGKDEILKGILPGLRAVFGNLFKVGSDLDAVLDGFQLLE